MMGEVPAPETSLIVNNSDNGLRPTNIITNNDIPLSQTFTSKLKNQYGPGILKIFRQYERNSIKLAKEENHLTFLCKCKQERIIPKGFLLKPPYSSKRAYKIMEKASWALIRDSINIHRYRKYKLKTNIRTALDKLENTLSIEDMITVKDLVKTHYQREDDKRKAAQKSKFETAKTHTKNYASKVTPLKAVKNLSKRELTSEEESVLNKGLNYSVTPSEPPKFDIAIAIEDACTKLTKEEASEYRWKVRAALDSVKKPECNISKSEQRALKSLKTDDAIMILPADKGNTTVVLDKTDYITKLELLINSDKYEKLTKDPTESIENKIGATLKKHKIPVKGPLWRKLKPNHSKPPHLYGLPKIHKDGTPLRPIVSSINSPCHALSKHLLDIISPLKGKTDSSVINSGDFVEQTKNWDPGPDDILVSFDVVSLFTNVPVKEALEVVKSKLEADATLQNRTELDINAIMDLLEICLTTTYFQLGNDFYEQKDGMAMGNPLSPVISDIYMEHFEELAITTAPKKPKIWKRYVDDTFIIWPHGRSELENFKDHINSIRSCIQFTMETELNKRLPFLDVLVDRSKNKITTSVYRKPTHTDRYLDFNSHHSNNIKVGIFKCLQQRAKTNCSDPKKLKEEENHLKNTMKRNGYPSRTIKSVFSQRPARPEIQEPPTHKASVVIPYYKGLSEKIRRIGSKHKVRTAFKSKTTLRKTLSKTRPKNENQDSRNCIYKIPCECGQVYYGESGRPLNTRLVEHKGYVRRGEVDRSKIADHVWDNDHRMQWKEAKIIHKEEHWRNRKIKEAAYMAIADNPPISRTSINIDPIWIPMLKEVIKKV